MTAEKIPENGHRINRDRFKFLLNAVIENARQWESAAGSFGGQHRCIFCDCNWDNRTIHSPECAYDIADEYLKEFY